MASSLATLSRGFRRSYLDHATLTAQLRAWADAFPELAHLSSIGTTPEGRDIWMLTIGHEPTRVRPAIWVDGNMHASELCGSSVALAIAEDVLTLHAGESPASPVAPHLARILKETLWYVVPRISPDGAEAVLTTGRYVRSVPRDGRLHGGVPRWIAGDVDGDGLALTMRKEDPTGDYVACPQAPRAMVPRTIDDPPPYYRLYPEGHIEHFDGETIPAPNYLGDNYPDLNRNFPFHWRTASDQIGAGDYPGSEPEARAVIEAAMARPNVFVWLNLHTFGGCFIRPPGDTPDEKMSPFDLGVYKQVGEWAESLTGYPMVSGYDEFLYEPGKPLYGALSEWAYEHRGALSYVCELWDLFPRLGMKLPKKFVARYTSMRREDLVALAKWDAEHNRSRVFVPWTRVTHPQLGEVEVGGLDRRVGITNPPYEELPGVCEKQSALMMRVASMVPRLTIARVELTPLREDVTAVSVTVDNQGYLPTYGMRGRKSEPVNEPISASVRTEGCTLEEPGRARVVLGHLEGWGKGLGAFEQGIFYAMSPGSDATRTLRWVVKGRGSLEVEIGSRRAGFVSRRIGIGGGV
jgi:hypothetical protein